MALHLIKLCVGVETTQELADWIAVRLREKAGRGLSAEHTHTTRMVPKRVEELLAGGSLYWVIRGEIACRQRLTAIRPFVDSEGVGRCHLVLDPELVLVAPRPFRPFQGWRYLAAKDAPPDLDRAGAGLAAMPEALRRELRELGLL